MLKTDTCVLVLLDIYSFFSAFGVDAAFSYTYNQRLGICDKEGLAVSSGFNTSHVIPVSLTFFVFPDLQALINSIVLLLTLLTFDLCVTLYIVIGSSGYIVRFYISIHALLL